jgi:hypothetical protein
MKRKGWMMVLLGVGIAILVTGGLVIAAGTGSKGCATDDVRGKAAGDIRMATCSGDGTCEEGTCEEGTCEEGTCEEGTCDGDCATCENQECVMNQGAESALGNAFNNAEGTCDGDCSGEGNGEGTCDGTGEGQQKRSGQQSGSCPMRQQ